MNENIKFIVAEVNKLLEKNYNLIGFSALNPEDLLQILSDVLIKIQQQDAPKIDIKTETPEQSSVRILSALRILKYQPNSDPVTFRQGIVRGDSETIYAILTWLLTHKDIVRQRAYLARFLVKIEIPSDYLGDPEIATLYEQYSNMVNQFKTIHKEREIGKKNFEIAAEFTEDLKAMEKEKEAVLLRIEKMKIKAQPALYLLDAARALRMEKDRERDLALQKEQESKIMSGLQISFQGIERELQTLKRTSEEITPQTLIQHLTDEVTVQTAIMKEKLAYEIEMKKKRIAALMSVRGYSYLGPDQITTLRNKLDLITKEIQGLVETKITKTDNDKMEPFRQQATTISNMKRNVLERLENTNDRLKEFQAKLEEKREQSKIFMEEIAPKGEDLKKYVAHLKIKSVSYKRYRAELTGLKAEIGVLQRTAVILKAQAALIDQGNKNLDLGKQSIPDNYTPANAFSTNVQLSKMISALRVKLLPLLNEVQALRQKSRDVKERYKKANTVQSTLETVIGSPTGNILFEINQLKEKIAKDKEEKERLEKALSKMKNLEERIQKEMDASSSSENTRSLKDELSDSIAKKMLIKMKSKLSNGIKLQLNIMMALYYIFSMDYIGFATLPEQVHRKSVKRGFEFTLMVLGETGLGKSTLINSLFLGDLYKERRIPDASERIDKTTTIEKKTMDIEERGVRLRLTIVDTPGFGDAVNCEDTWKPCLAYIDEQFRQYFTDESGLNRKNIQDNRVHCCLYFIPPYGHGLRQLDLEVLRRLHRKVNVVPVIAKADTLTTQEVKKLKERILADIEEHEIQIYQFPDCDSDEDEEFKQQDKELKACIPFAVVGSSTVLEVAGRKVHGRQYPWGVVEVENPKHSDFVKLRTMLISTHMQDLKDVTQDVHYENFRAQCISQISQQAIRERSKLKRDSGPHFENNISDTDRLLLQKDEEIRRMQDILAQMQEKLKATGQVGNNIGMRGRVGSLGNDLDVTDVDKKRSKMTAIIIFLGLIVLGKSQLIYPDQYEYMKTSIYPAYANSQRRSYSAGVAYAAPAAAAAAAPMVYYASGTAPVAYSAPAGTPVVYSAPAAAPVAYSAPAAALGAYSAPAAPVAYSAPTPAVASVEYYASGAAPVLYYAAAPASMTYYSSSASIVNQLPRQPKETSLSQAASQIDVNTVAAPISPLAQSLPSDWAYRVNDIISKGVTKLALNIQNVIYSNNLASVKDEKNNIVFSPLNIAGSLALVHLGSAGITFEEVSRILGLAAGVDISTHSELVHQMFGLLISVVHEKVLESTRIIDIASAIFLQEGFPIRPEFRTISENVYQSVVMNLNFQERGKEAQDKVNAWVKEKTNGKISTILNDIPSPATKVIIASALYFNAEWNRYFIKGATGRKVFSIEPNEQILVDMMYNAGDFPFYEDKNYGVKIVGLPYKGLDTTMYIMLPKAEGARALGEFERTLTPEIIEYLIENTRNQTTIIGMPKMKITSSLKLKKVLESLGLTSLFNPQTADLSLLSPGSGELIANSVSNPATNSTRSNKNFNNQNRQSNNRDQLVLSRFGGDVDGEQYKKHLFKYTDNTHRYNIEQWATGFNIRRSQRKRREIKSEQIDDENNVQRVRRQNRPMSEDFLRIIENRNFRSFGLDDLRNSATVANPGLYADEVLHKVDIDINEKGTEAAAATAIVLERDGRQKRLLANRPFLFFIRHNPTKLILFWGTINTPTPNFSNT
ncbi:leukocyte elastase inhibitor-like isoform X1 [Vespula squamosa]|uniref:Intraflagellar transport protein 81 homolog n=1 Tax=Vespula squamosa TaxID=30214 RepID=A0ABD2B828_VESSQ